MTQREHLLWSLVSVIIIGMAIGFSDSSYAHSFTRSGPTGAGGGGLEVSDAELLFLKLDASNGPLTGGLTSSVASGSNAIGFLTNGARLDFGTGATDYLFSDGASVNAAGGFVALGSLTVLGTNVSAGTTDIRVNLFNSGGASVKIADGLELQGDIFDSRASSPVTVSDVDGFDVAAGPLTVSGISTLTGSVGIGVTPGASLDIGSTGTPIRQTRYSATASQGAGINIRRSKGATVGTDTVLVDGDKIATLNFQGFDSAAYLAAAQIQVFVDGDPGANDMPGRLVFLTTADGAAASTERMRIDNSGDVILAAGSNLSVGGGQVVVTGSDPVLSSCGSTPTVVGADSAGKVTMGTAGPTSCTVTFAVAFAVAPACVVTGDDSATTYAATTSTTVLTITSSADMSADVVNYICMGL